MRYRLPAITIIMLAGALLWVLVPHKPETEVARSENPSKSREENQASSDPAHLETSDATPEVPPNSESAEAVPAGHPPAALAVYVQEHPGPEVAPGLTPAIVLENMRTVFRQYSSRFRGNPVGTNQEITSALNGKNPGKVVFLNSEDGMRINDQGELVDNWGTPYFFHQLSGTEMEIHSAGPDRKMWTSDDLVTK
jgi:hypothetical protein